MSDGLLTNFGSLSGEAEYLAKSESLAMDDCFASTSINEAQILAAANTTEALAFKNAWVPLVNQQQMFKHMLESLSVDRFPFVIDVLEHSNDKFDYATGERSVVRALFRPLSEDETRKEAVTESPSVSGT